MGYVAVRMMEDLRLRNYSQWPQYAYLERDVPAFGPRVAAGTLRRLWQMLAHLEGSRMNVANLARNLDVDAKTAGRYIDLLVDLLLVRRLPAWPRDPAAPPLGALEVQSLDHRGIDTAAMLRADRDAR